MRQKRAMAVHALTEVEVLPGQDRQALWAAARLSRRLARRPGFHGFRVYRSERAAGALLILTEWSEWDAAAAAEREAPVAKLLEQARAVCAHWESRRLEPLFHLQLPRRRPSTGIAQTLRAGVTLPDTILATQKAFGLKAMSLPGTIGVLGGRCAQDRSFFFVALEFDTEAALTDFGGSATRHQWARSGAPQWWRKEPRLEVCPARRRPAGRETERRSEQLGKLSVHVESSPDGTSVILRLHGSLDEIAAERFGRVREAIITGGCRDLTLDVSQLSAATTEGLKALVTTARQVKAAGGQFTLADNQGRYHQILRTWHLNQALTPKAKKVPSVRLRTSGSA